MKFPIYEMSLSMKCLYLWNIFIYEMSLSMKCLYLLNVFIYEMSYLWNVLSMKCPILALQVNDTKVQDRVIYIYGTSGFYTNITG